MEWLSKSTVFLCGLGGGVMTSIFKDEVTAWLPRTTAKIIDMASKRMPLDQKDQCREEWSAHVAEYAGNITPLYQAVCILIGAGRSKIWTVGRVLRHMALALFVFQIYNLYILSERITEHVSTDYFANSPYMKAALDLISIIIMAVCLRLNIRDVRSAISRKPQTAYGNETSVREAAAVTGWFISWSIKRKFRKE